jgi:hypothetical protein
MEGLEAPVSILLIRLGETWIRSARTFAAIPWRTRNSLMFNPMCD